MAGGTRGARPRWRYWESDSGHQYATGCGLSAHMPGASVTVDADSIAGLEAAIAEAEREAGRVTDFRERFGG